MFIDSYYHHRYYFVIIIIINTNKFRIEYNFKYLTVRSRPKVFKASGNSTKHCLISKILIYCNIDMMMMTTIMMRRWPTAMTMTTTMMILMLMMVVEFQTRIDNGKHLILGVS